MQPEQPARFDDASSFHVNRRRWLQQTSGALVGAATLAAAGQADEPAQPRPVDLDTVARVVRNGRIRQSIVQWCFSSYWNPEELIRLAHRLGCGSVELLAPQYFPLLKELDMECAIASVDMGPDPPFAKGMNNPQHRERVLKATRDAIDACAQFGFRRVIAFTGMRDGIPDDVGAANCVAAGVTGDPLPRTG